MKRNLIRLAPCLEAEPPNGGSITSTFTAPYVYSVIVAYELRRPPGDLTHRSSAGSPGSSRGLPMEVCADLLRDWEALMLHWELSNSFIE